MCFNQSRVLHKCLIKQGHGKGQVAQWTQQRSIREIELSCFIRALIQCWLKRSLKNLVNAFFSLVYCLFPIFGIFIECPVYCLPWFALFLCEGREKNYNFTILFSKYWQTFCLWHFTRQIGEEDDINQLLDFVLAFANYNVASISM